jgi:AcrR family transcriptional regulator
MADAGLTRGGFYSYFDSKSDLYAEALACFFTDPNWKSHWEGVQVDLYRTEITILKPPLRPLPLCASAEWLLLERLTIKCLPTISAKPAWPLR